MTTQPATLAFSDLFARLDALIVALGDRNAAHDYLIGRLASADPEAFDRALRGVENYLADRNQPTT